MSDNFVIVWRPSEGAAVATFSAENKEPRVFTDLSAPEAEGSDVVSDPELQDLLASRAVFEPKRVPLHTAERLLGWSVIEQKGNNA